MSRLSESKTIWETDYSKRFPFHAESPVSVKPPLVDTAIGPSASVVMRIGWRTWGFKTAAERDRFVVQFGGFKL